jgi:hypothetical protein
VNLVPVSALLGSISLCLLPAFVGPAAAPQNPSKKDDVPTYSGLIGDWYVAVPGRVQFQLVGSGRDIKDGKTPDLWFETPADKDVNMLYENLVLDVILHASTKGLPVIVEAKNSSGDDGSVAAKAFDILRVGIGRN